MLYVRENPFYIFKEKIMKTKAMCLLCVVLLVLAFSSCDSFFSSTWGTQREYDMSRISLNTGNLNDWINAALGNPGLSLKLAEKINNEMGSKSGPERKEFSRAGVKLAVEASGIGPAALTSVDAITDANELKGLLESIDSKVNKDAAGVLAGIINNGDITGLDASDAGMAVIVLTLAVVNDAGKAVRDVGELHDLEAFGVKKENDKFVVVQQSGVTQNATALVKLLNAIVTGSFDNPITDAIQGAFTQG